LRHFVTVTGLSAAALHDPVESFEIGAGFSFLEKARCLQSGNLFRHSCRNELVDARSFFSAQPLNASFNDRGRRRG
jgi:hypothetical protein